MELKKKLNFCLISRTVYVKILLLWNCFVPRIFLVLSYVRCNRFCISSFVVYPLGISVGNLFPPLFGPLNLRAKFGFGGKSVLCPNHVTVGGSFFLLADLLVLQINKK